MILFPNAKINIGLNITGKRSDGYHDIVTLFYPVPWRDILEIVPAKSTKTTLTVTGRHVDCPPEKNLVIKAYNALNDIIPLPPVDIHLHKIIPDGAGLGGGSADASFTLKGLNRMFELGLSDDTLAGTAAKLGADCAFFIYNRPRIARGIGNIFSDIDIDLSMYTIAIVKPSDGVSTAQAYSGVHPSMPAIPLEDTLKDDISKWKDTIYNDFEKSVFPLRPEIEAAKKTLYDMGAVYASMTGSGASVYGIFTTDSDTLSATVGAMFPDYDTLVQPLAL